MPPIYDKPTKVLMREFVDQQLTPGQVFDKRQAVDWFASHYPDIRPTTVQMHVEGMAVNSGSRKHHPSIKPGSGHDLFYKVAPGKFRLWNSETDSSPIYKDQGPSTLSNRSNLGPRTPAILRHRQVSSLLSVT